MRCRSLARVRDLRRGKFQEILTHLYLYPGGDFDGYSKNSMLITEAEALKDI